jgi:hypothetical protein
MCSVTIHEIPGPVEITAAISFCLGLQCVPVKMLNDFFFDAILVSSLILELGSWDWSTKHVQLNDEICWIVGG